MYLQANLAKKRLPCLRCGRVIWTDAAHRFCRKCRRHNAATAEERVYSLNPGRSSSSAAAGGAPGSIG